MFLGEYKHTLDEKFRFAVPSKFRRKIKQGSVLTRGLDSCLFLYPVEEWKKLADVLVRLPLGQKDGRAFARFMLAGAMEVSMDAQGRILVPDYLRTFARIRRNIVIAGLYTKLEIWDEETWEQYKGATEQRSVEIAERMGAQGV